jgi:hypothetical protein
MITLFENYDKYIGNMWLFPTDERFKKSVKSMPELFNQYGDIINSFDDIPTFLSRNDHNPNYIFIGTTDGDDWSWNDLSAKSFEYMKFRKWNYVGPINIPEEEYENIMRNLESEKYNL